ncbi:hypothetical protein [Echinicola vietnamensis]|uniref:Group 1 truncated hemoglobin n=1 Tax=Echinicola vietnamensis (strain DSM 17526 / LMG 23754 / KMM 6221) TaxID=926556 RepID=L0G085_ECHVK|nr:hypothetical protein [Echinicola vietnamensis]AGA78703.1 hypothetical protein Echvi_2456 [Echinicola vietnamensis DSM 17526]
MKRLNQFSVLLLLMTAVVFWSCNDKDDMDQIKEMDDSFYATKLGGEMMVADPSNDGQMIEQGYLNLRTIVTGTVLKIASEDKYAELRPYFNVLLAEVGADDMSGFNALVKDFTDLLAESTGAKNFTYSGMSMADAHNPEANDRMNGMIDNEDFDLFVEAVVEVATDAGFGDQEILGPVGQLLEGTRDAIVQREDGTMIDLYTRLGGTVMVEDADGNMEEAGYLPLKAVVTETVLLVASDPEFADLKPYFPVLLAEVGAGDMSGFNTLVENFSDLLAQSIGSTNYMYEGMNMADAHNPDVNPRMTGKITSADYDLFIQAVVKAATNKGVPESVIAEFGALLTSEGLKGAIVQG